MGDTFFNGFYPVIDASTGGKIDGMIVAADKALSLADNNTRIVPGHGPLGNKADLTRYREMLVVVRDRAQKLKTAGKSNDEIVASNLWQIWTLCGVTACSAVTSFCGWFVRHFNSHPSCGLDHRSGVGVEAVLGREGDLVSAKADVDDLLKVGRSSG
jgi:hypothetical protein